MRAPARRPAHDRRVIAQPAHPLVACPSCHAPVTSDMAACSTCGAEPPPAHFELGLVLHDVARLAGKAVAWSVLIGVLAVVTWMATHGGRPY